MRRLVAALMVVLVVAAMAPMALGAGPEPTPAGSPADTAVPAASQTVPTPTPAATPAASNPSTPEATPPLGSGAESVPELATSGPKVPVQPLAVAVSTTTSFNLPPSYGVRGYAQQYDVYTSPTPSGGTVDLLINGAVVDTASYAGGSSDVILHWTPSASGSFTMAARFNGTAGFAASQSPDYSVPVVNPQPSIQIGASNPTPAFGETVDYTATFTPDPGAGSIEWWVDGVLIITKSIENGGVSHFSTAFDTPYSHQVHAHFTGNANYNSSDGYYNFSINALSTSVSITVPPAPIAAGPVTVHVAVSPNPGGGTITWNRTYVGNTDVPLGSDGTVDIPLGSLDFGTYTVNAAFNGHGQYGPSSAQQGFKVLQAAAVTLTASRATAVVGELPVVLTATVTPHSYPGTITFVDDVEGSVLELGPVDYSTNDGTAVLSSNTLRVGTHTIRARFNGVDNLIAPALSDPVTVTVVADTAVHGTFKQSLSAFYPYKDGYRDTVTYSGSLDEVASVAIKIYTSTGALKRSFSLANHQPGAYSVVWNGKTATGSNVAAGKYTVRATLRDGLGHTATITLYTTVSWRQAVWKTATAVTRYGDQLSYYGTPGSSLYKSGDYSRGRTMVTTYINRDCAPGCMEIYGSTVFQLNTTALDVRYVAIKVVGHDFVDWNPGEGVFYNWATSKPVINGPLPEYLAYPYTFTAPRWAISSTRKVRFYAWCSEDMGDAFDVHYLKLTYQYAVWK